MNLPRYVYLVLGFVALVLVGNLVLLDFFFVKQRNELIDFQTRLTLLSDNFKMIGSRVFALPPTGETTTATPSAATPDDQLVRQYVCPQSCVTLINDATKPVAAARQSTTSLVSGGTTQSATKEFFIPLGSGILTQINTWTDMNGVQGSFNTDNYSAVKSAFFEASLRTNGSGQVQARLYDTTTPAVFWDAQITSSSVTGEYFSKPINLYKGGSKTYRVQMNTSLSTGFIDQARIHLVTQ